MYQIMKITDRGGGPKPGSEVREHQGCIGEAQMEDGCVLIHCRYNRKGDPCDRYIRTSLVQNWQKDKDTGRIVVETLNSVYTLDPVRME